MPCIAGGGMRGEGDGNGEQRKRGETAKVRGRRHRRM